MSHRPATAAAMNGTAVVVYRSYHITGTRLPRGTTSPAAPSAPPPQRQSLRCRRHPLVLLHLIFSSYVVEPSAFFLFGSLYLFAYLLSLCSPAIKYFCNRSALSNVECQAVGQPLCSSVILLPASNSFGPSQLSHIALLSHASTIEQSHWTVHANSEMS